MNSRPPPTRPRKRLDAAAGPLVENFSLTAFLSFTWRLRLIRIPSPLPLPFPYLLLPTHLSRRLPPPPSLSFTVPHRRPFLFLVLLVPTSMNGILSSPVSPTRARARAHMHEHTDRTHRDKRNKRVRSLLASRPSNAVFRCSTYVRTYVRIYR